MNFKTLIALLFAFAIAVPSYCQAQAAKIEWITREEYSQELPSIKLEEMNFEELVTRLTVTAFRCDHVQKRYDRYDSDPDAHAFYAKMPAFYRVGDRGFINNLQKEHKNIIYQMAVELLKEENLVAKTIKENHEELDKLERKLNRELELEPQERGITALREGKSNRDKKIELQEKSGALNFYYLTDGNSAGAKNILPVAELKNFPMSRINNAEGNLPENIKTEIARKMNDILKDQANVSDQKVMLPRLRELDLKLEQQHKIGAQQAEDDNRQARAEYEKTPQYQDCLKAYNEGMKKQNAGTGQYNFSTLHLKNLDRPSPESYHFKPAKYFTAKEVKELEDKKLRHEHQSRTHTGAGRNYANDTDMEMRRTFAAMANNIGIKLAELKRSGIKFQ